MGAFDRWFEHAGFVNGTFYDTEAPGCVPDGAVAARPLRAEGPGQGATDRGLRGLT